MTAGPASGNADVLRALQEVLAAAGMDSLDSSSVRVHGADPVVPSRFRLGAAVAGALGAQALGVAEIWKARGGRDQRLDIDLAQAAYPGLNTFLHIRQNGHPLPFTRWEGQGPNFFPTRDGRRMYLLYTATYVQHCLRLHAFLGASTHHDAIARSVARWDAQALEDALAERRLIGAVARTRDEWLAHPQGRWLQGQGPVLVQRLADSEPERLAPGPRPLSGVRVLDMAHVLAGPVTSRVLAEQGAEVLHVSAAHQPDGYLNDIDTGFGKRTAFLDLERAEDRAQLRALLREADVFVQSWRPGALARRGFSHEEIAALRPGIVQASLSCYGNGGPWRERGGYEPLGQAVTGLAIAEGSPDEPRLACTFTLNDYLTAYLTAAGIVGALLRRTTQGGTYHVQASLARSSMWVQELGPLPPAQWPGAAGGVSVLPELPEHYFQTTESVFGTLRHPAPIVRYSATPAAWSRPPSPMGRERPHW